MWLLGHAAIGYIVAKTALRNHRLKPIMIPLIIIFSVQPDFFHWREYRVLSHNFLAILILSGALLLLLRLFVKLNRAESITLMVVALFHGVADSFFGSFYAFVIPDLFVDGITEQIRTFDFGQEFHLTVELFIGIFMILVLIGSKDYLRFKKGVREIITGDGERKDRKSGGSLPRFFLIVCLIIYSLIMMFQTAIFVGAYFRELAAGIWLHWVLLIMIFWLATMQFHPIFVSGREFGEDRVHFIIKE